MNDLISRQAAIDALKPLPTIDGLGLQPLVTVDDAIKVLNNLPSVQPVDKDINVSCKDAISRQGAIEPLDIVFDEPTIEERKTGKWINANDGKWNTVEVLKCSVCGEIDNRMYRTDNFCPNCGAKMEEGGQE